MKTEAAAGCSIESGLEAVRFLRVLAQHVDAPREQTGNYVGTRGTHGCTGQIDGGIQIFDGAIERDGTFARNPLRQGTAAGENAHQTISCSAKPDGLEIDPAVVRAAD
jgi:hypothetical protein